MSRNDWNVEHRCVWRLQIKYLLWYTDKLSSPLDRDFSTGSPPSSDAGRLCMHVHDR